MERYAYFMVRVTQPESAAIPAERIAGVVERLASGEKRRFESAEELLRLVAGWPAEETRKSGGSDA